MATWQDRFVQAFGDAAGRSGVLSEMAGKIYGALYLTVGPLSLDEICDRLGASKGNVSVQIRDLVSLGMVRKAPGEGRRHYYEANVDLWPIATELIGRRLENEGETFLRDLGRIEPDVNGDAAAAVKARLASMRTFLEMVTNVVREFRKAESPRPDELQKLLRS